ncbi:MAG: hypothetical protein KH241_07850 [Clostridium sp.]|nr:hypothetical protein [Clostridium sp.]MEE0031292.1 hypothetical protein [Lachnospiraceae bacterium]
MLLLPYWVTAFTVLAIPACFIALLGDCFYGFGDFSLLLLPYWVTAFTVLAIPACFIALLGDCFYGFGDSSLLYRLIG